MQREAGLVPGRIVTWHLWLKNTSALQVYWASACTRVSDWLHVPVGQGHVSCFISSSVCNARRLSTSRRNVTSGKASRPKRRLTFPAPPLGVKAAPQVQPLGFSPHVLQAPLSHAGKHTDRGSNECPRWTQAWTSDATDSLKFGDDASCPLSSYLVRALHGEKHGGGCVK